MSAVIPIRVPPWRYRDARRCAGPHVDPASMPHGRRHALAALLAASVLCTGCATTYPLMPTPTVYVGQHAQPLFPAIPAESQKTSVDLLYVTNRAPGTAATTTRPYSAERSRSMAFGAVTIEFGAGVPWETLVAQSTLSSARCRWTCGSDRRRSWALSADLLRGRGHPAGLVRVPATIDAHEQAAAALQAEVARRLAAAPRKEVVLFVHGYANTFQDASFTMGELCHFLGREFVCAIFTWPAGGSRGLFFGYNVDRESGEFAVFHLKQALRIIADTPGVGGCTSWPTVAAPMWW